MGLGLSIEIKSKDGFGNIANRVTPHESDWATYHSPATGTKATTTQPAVAGKRHYITGFAVTSNETGKTVQLKFGTTVKMKFVFQTTEGYFYAFPSPLQAGVNEAVTLEFETAPTAGYWQNVNLAGFTE